MIGRQKERSDLLNARDSEYSEFVAVYGRRRVGKTFLIRETFDYRFTFQHSGVKLGGAAVQLARFRKSLQTQGYAECPELKDWFAAFDALRIVVERSVEGKKVIFLEHKFPQNIKCATRVRRALLRGWGVRVADAR